MKSFLFACFAAAATANKMSAKFMEHIVEFGKSYDTTEEFEMRKAIFTALDYQIEAENANGNNFVLGHNQFSTWTHDEYAGMLGYKPHEHEKKAKKQQHHKKHMKAPRAASPVDWRDEGAVTPVKDQGQCGSCWTFSSTGALEGAHQIKSGDLLSFSEQQLVDCAHFIAFGCGGGNEATAFNYLKKANIMSEDSYPYTAVDTADCLYDESKAYDFGVESFIAVTPQSADALKDALANGPVSVNIEADKMVFQTYTSGILDSTKCGTSIDHAVLAVGWGADEETGQEYWIVKNSWNTTWGDQGYIKLAIVDGMGICGVQSGPFQPYTTA